MMLEFSDRRPLSQKPVTTGAIMPPATLTLVKHVRSVTVAHRRTRCAPAESVLTVSGRSSSRDHTRSCGANIRFSKHPPKARRDAGATQDAPCTLQPHVLCATESALKCAGFNGCIRTQYEHTNRPSTHVELVTYARMLRVGSSIRT
eukprot:255732-Pyramimonas_sp.AAC.1